MANLTNLVYSIRQNIKENNEQLITGDIMQEQLLAIVNILNNEKQDISSDSLKTENKNIVHSINELYDIIQKNDKGVGKVTIFNGEIFNDYDNNQANGRFSNAHGQSTIANNIGETAIGKYNVSFMADVPDKKSVFTVGIGENTNRRKNAITVMENGNVYIDGIGGYNKDNINDNVTNVKPIQKIINDIPEKIMEFDGSMSEIEINEILKITK